MTGAVNRDFWTYGSFANVVAGTALGEPRRADFVAGTGLGEPRSADFVAGTALCEPRSADFVAGTPLHKPRSADFVAGTRLGELMGALMVRDHVGVTLKYKIIYSGVGVHTQQLLFQGTGVE